MSGTNSLGLKGSGFDSRKKLKADYNNNTLVVDARNVPSGLSKAVEKSITKAYAKSPHGVSERVRKGFQAVAQRDWKVAKAWFQEALNREPSNAGLKRLVELCDTTQQPTKPSPQPNSQSQLQLPDPNDIYFMFPGLKKTEDEQALNYLFGLGGTNPPQAKPKNK